MAVHQNVNKGDRLVVTAPFAFMDRIDFDPGDQFQVASERNGLLVEVKPVHSKRDGASVPDIIVQVPRTELWRYFKAVR